MESSLGSFRFIDAARRFIPFRYFVDRVPRDGVIRSRETKRFDDAEKKRRKEGGMRVRSFRCSLEHRVFIYERKFDRGGT